jgi:hypothetical protein
MGPVRVNQRRRSLWLSIGHCADCNIDRAVPVSAKLTGRRKFGSNALKVNGKLFALFTQGMLAVELWRDRVAALVGLGRGQAVQPGEKPLPPRQSARGREGARGREARQRESNPRAATAQPIELTLPDRSAVAYIAALTPLAMPRPVPDLITGLKPS